ncbi:MAG: HPP family protein [Gracilimonas sp.]
MNYKPITISLKATMLILPLGIIAWYSGNAFIFPSLGPTAYLMAVEWNSKLSLREVLGGHICGVIGGSVSYFWLVSPATMINLSGLQSEAGLQIALGAGLAIFLTSVLMILTKTSHPPACATTLIISLGFLPKIHDGLVIVFAVAVLYILYHFLFMIIEKANKNRNFKQKG